MAVHRFLAICFLASAAAVSLRPPERRLQLSYGPFNESIKDMYLVGDARADKEGLHLTRTEQLNNNSHITSIGRAIHKHPIRSSSNISFATNFSFAIHALDSIPLGHGIAFVIASKSFITQLQDMYSRHGGWLGLFNTHTNGLSANQLVAVEFDTYLNNEHAFNDHDDNHIGINVNSIYSRVQTAPHTLNDTFGVDIGSGALLTAWIEYDGTTKSLSVFASQKSIKPASPVLSYKVDLASINPLDVYFGFSSATGTMNELNTLYSWHLVATANAGSYGKSNNRRSIVVIASTVGGFFLLCLAAFIVRFSCKKKLSIAIASFEGKNNRAKEEAILVYGPRKYTYKELVAATEKFHNRHLLGTGGFGSVYRGTLREGTKVAIKRISQHSKQGEREFIAEVTTIGRLSHRNLVRLYGWCHEKDELLLVYEYMPNGSLDKHLQRNGAAPLSWSKRYNIICGLAAALHYLHEEWGQRVVHRDIKPSNVMLDSTFNTKLGDFGLARVAEHSKTTDTTTVVAGTLGYIAPEVSRTLKATTFSDVFSFGVVALELASGRKPADLELLEEQVVQVEYAGKLKEETRLLDLADPRLAGEFDTAQMKTLLQVGVACTHAEPHSRPIMRHILQVLRGDLPLSAIPAINEPRLREIKAAEAEVTHVHTFLSGPA